MAVIELTQGKVSVIDDSDYILLKKYSWSYHKDGYAHSKIVWNGKPRMILMHRLIMGIVDNPKLMTDHIDMDGLNNKRSNLRVCNHTQNGYNRKSYKGSKSKYKGVTKRCVGNKWRARIRKDTKLINIGTFNTEEEAAIAYNKKAIELHGEFARINNIKKIGGGLSQHIN